MAKKVMVVLLSLSILVLFVGNTMAVEKASKTATPKIKKLPQSAVLSSSSGTVVYSTDFETADEWNAVQLGTTGPVFEWVDDNSYSPSHSWWVPDDTPMSADDAIEIETAIISPSIELPTELNGAPIRGLSLSYWADVKTPSTAESGNVFDVFQTEIFVPYAGDNYWQVSEYEAFEGSSWWCGSSSSSNTYAENWRQELRTPVLDLSAATGAVMLTFKNAPNSEPGYDYCYLEISNDEGVTWQRLARWDEENDPVEWFDESYDITDYASGTVIVRWFFESDGGYQSTHAWHIDNVQIADDATTYLFDDGGDTALALEAVEHPYSWSRMHYEYAETDGDHLPPGWNLIDDAQVAWNGTLDLLQYAGMTVQFRIRVSTDGWNRLGIDPGYGFYFDDFEITAVGKAEYDIEVLGANTLNAKVGMAHVPTVYFMNVGLNAATGNFLFTGTVSDAADSKVATIFAQAVIDVAPDSIFSLQPSAGWTPKEPGTYNLTVISSLREDSYPLNDTLSVEIFVPGGPHIQTLYQEDFDSNPAATSLEDFGFTVENGGGDQYGNNENTWIYYEGFYYGNTAMLGWNWADANLGANFTDSSEVMSEGLVTPTIDISSVGMYNTLGLQAYVYFRPSHPSYDLFGAQISSFAIEASVDDGATWTQCYYFADDDSLPNGAKERLPLYRYDDVVLDYLALVDFDLTPAVRNRAEGDDKLKIRFQLESENSWFLGLAVDEILVYKGIGAPKVSSVKDVPEDNGKQVQVYWMPGTKDLMIWDHAGIGVPVTHYNVWREDPVLAATAKPIKDVTAMLSSSAKLGDSFVTDDDVVWSYVATVPAMGWQAYSVVAATLADETETSFMVSAHTDDSMLFECSSAVSGKSTDDLAPEAPTSALASTSGNEVTVSWEASMNRADDLQYYNLYRDGELVVSTIDLTFQESLLDGEYTYEISAVDFAGNESAKASVTVQLATSVADQSSAIPTDYALAQNFPNPFNPATHINYALPKAGHVTVKVYNTAGQEIATLVDGNQSAGNFTAVWNAVGQSSGVYFYSIKADGFSKTMKMILMK